MAETADARDLNPGSLKDVTVNRIRDHDSQGNASMWIMHPPTDSVMNMILRKVPFRLNVTKLQVNKQSNPPEHDWSPSVN